MLHMTAAAVEPDLSRMALWCLLVHPAMASPDHARAVLAGPLGVEDRIRRLPPDALHRPLQYAHNLRMPTMHPRAS